MNRLPKTIWLKLKYITDDHLAALVVWTEGSVSSSMVRKVFKDEVEFREGGVLLTEEKQGGNI